MGTKAIRGLTAWIRRRALIAGAAGVIASSMVAPIGAHAASGTVLILGPTVIGGASSQEALEAVHLGFTVSVVDGPTWDSLTTAQFATYSALILGDPNCGGEFSVSAAEANVATWSPAVNGNVAVVGTDPVFHALNFISGALKVTDDAVDYALARPGTTGAYISLSCYYAGAGPSTSVAVLAGLGTFSVQGNFNCSDSGHVETDVASGSAWSNLTNADLQSWFCSLHETFDQWPSSYKPLAIDPSATPPNFTGSDNIPGRPYILISGQGACRPTVSVSPDPASTGTTDLNATCLAPGEKVDVLLNTEAGAVLVDQPTTDAVGAITNDQFNLPVNFIVNAPNANGFTPSVTVPLLQGQTYQLDVIGETADDGGRLLVNADSRDALTAAAGQTQTTPGPGCVAANNTAPPASAPTNLTASGRWIVDHNGKRVKLVSANWYGAEQADFVVGGLQCQSITTIAANLFDLSLNSVRLPFSNAMVEENPGSCNVSPAPLEQPCISPGLLLANPSLQSLKALDIYRAVIDAFAKIGIMVVLDDHTTDAQWAPGDGDGIWWGGTLWDDVVANAACSGDDNHCWHRRMVFWMNDWITMVNLFSGEGNVIGVDLRNEPTDQNSYGLHEVWCSATCPPMPHPTPGPPPQPPGPAAPPPQPQVSSPRAEPSQLEWGAAAEWAGNAVLSIDPNLLIFVEGLNFSSDLTQVFTNPLTLQSPGHLVYSPHSYPKFTFGTPLNAIEYRFLSPGDLATTLGKNWGYIVTQNQPFTAPVWVGEFGDCNNATDTCASAFRANFITYLKSADFDWAYWPLNANYSDAGSSKLTQSWFDTEIFGILDQNWANPRNPSLGSALPIACTQGPTGPCP